MRISEITDDPFGLREMESAIGGAAVSASNKNAIKVAQSQAKQAQKKAKLAKATQKDAEARTLRQSAAS